MDQKGNMLSKSVKIDHVTKAIQGQIKNEPGPSLQETAFVDNAGHNLAPLHVYVSVNGIPFSTPTKEQAESLKRPLGNSVEHKISGAASQCDHSFITINHYATAMDVYNGVIGETRVTVKDMDDFQVHEITNVQESLSIMRKYNEDIRTVPNTIKVITFKTKRIDHNVEWLTRVSLSKAPKASKYAKPLMKSLTDILLTMSSETPLEMSWLSYQLNDHNPYEMFFATNEQIMRQKILPLSAIPNVRDDSSFELSVQPRHTRYVNAEKQIVHLLVGAANDHRYQEFRMNELEENQFKVFVLPCPHVQDESRCILIVLPEGKGRLLPRNGETCRVVPPTYKPNDSKMTPIKLRSWTQMTTQRTAEAEDAKWDNQATDDSQTETDDILWCSATRLDIDVLRKKPEWQTYLVQQSKTMGTKSLKFAYKLVTSESNIQTAKFKRVSSDKPIKAMCLALNSLKWPLSSPTDIHTQSLDAYRYLLRFEPKTEVNLFEKVPELNSVANGEGPEWLLHEISNMDRPKRQAFATLSKMVGGIKFIPGAAACGKSTLLQNIILCTFFGGTSTEAKHSSRKVLYCVNNNAALDTFAMNLQSKMERLGLGAQAPTIVRLYGMESEVKKIMVTGKPAANSFDHKAAQLELENPQFSETDIFLAFYVILQEEINIRRKKAACPNMSLQEAAVHYHINNKESHEILETHLQKVRSDQSLEREEMNVLKFEIKQLYSDFLFQFEGIVCSTPIAASDYLFRTHFRPDLVLIDEGGRLPELELLVLIAWYPGPWIVVGDKQQLGPFVQKDPTVKNETQSLNPFIKQIGYSSWPVLLTPV
ncbi:hypothetical protein FQN57_000596 [Myotisia sp. PD_48]|nr:hypothetical protein FQN57_000596 [Myotisia sp. PD_48]